MPDHDPAHAGIQGKRRLIGNHLRAVKILRRGQRRPRVIKSIVIDQILIPPDSLRIARIAAPVFNGIDRSGIKRHANVDLLAPEADAQQALNTVSRPRER